MLPHTRDWTDLAGSGLPPSAPLPTDVPFTVEQAAALGVSRAQLANLLQRHEIRRLLKGVYVSAHQADTIQLRARALSLVVPDSAVVTDLSAAWLHGVAILPRSALTETPDISLYQRSGTRVRRPGVDGGRRQMLDRDVTLVGGVQVTTPLRTSLDLGRLLWRCDALAALDGFLRLGASAFGVFVALTRVYRDQSCNGGSTMMMAIRSIA